MTMATWQGVVYNSPPPSVTHVNGDTNFDTHTIWGLDRAATADHLSTIDLDLIEPPVDFNTNTATSLNSREEELSLNTENVKDFDFEEASTSFSFSNSKDVGEVKKNSCSSSLDNLTNNKDACYLDNNEETSPKEGDGTYLSKEDVSLNIAYDDSFNEGLRESPSQESEYSQYVDGFSSKPPSLVALDKDSPTNRSTASTTSERASRLDQSTYQSYASGVLHSSQKGEQFLKLRSNFADAVDGGEMTAASTDHTYENRRRSYHSRAQMASLTPADIEKDDRAAQNKTISNSNERETIINMSRDNSSNWSPERDRGLQNSARLDERMDWYQQALDLTDSHQSPPRPFNGDLKRGKSFGDLYSVYDGTSTRPGVSASSERSSKVAENLKPRDRSRSSHQSYIDIMEKASQNKKQRPIYGTNIGKRENSYERRVTTSVRQLKQAFDQGEPPLRQSTSSPDISRSRAWRGKGNDQALEDTPLPLTKSLSTTSVLLENSFVASSQDTVPDHSNEQDSFLVSSLETLPSYSDIRKFDDHSFLSTGLSSQNTQERYEHSEYDLMTADCNSENDNGFRSSNTISHGRDDILVLSSSHKPNGQDLDIFNPSSDSNSIEASSVVEIGNPYEINVSELPRQKSHDEDSGTLHVRSASAPHQGKAFSVAPEPALLYRTNSSKDTFFGTELSTPQVTSINIDYAIVVSDDNRRDSPLSTSQAHQHQESDDLLDRRPSSEILKVYSSESDNPDTVDLSHFLSRTHSKDIFTKHVESAPSRKGSYTETTSSRQKTSPKKDKSKPNKGGLNSDNKDRFQSLEVESLVEGSSRRSRLLSDHSDIRSDISSPSKEYLPATTPAPLVSQYEDLIAKARKERMARKGYLHSYVNEPGSAELQHYTAITDTDHRFRNAYPWEDGLRQGLPGKESSHRSLDPNLDNSSIKTRSNRLYSSDLDDPFSPVSPRKAHKLEGHIVYKEEKENRPPSDENIGFQSTDNSADTSARVQSSPVHKRGSQHVPHTSNTELVSDESAQPVRGRHLVGGANSSFTHTNADLEGNKGQNSNSWRVKESTPQSGSVVTPSMPDLIQVDSIDKKVEHLRRLRAEKLPERRLTKEKQEGPTVYNNNKHLRKDKILEINLDTNDCRKPDQTPLAAPFKVADLRSLAKNSDFAVTTFPRMKLPDNIRSDSMKFGNYPVNTPHTTEYAAPTEQPFPRGYSSRGEHNIADAHDSQLSVGMRNLGNEVNMLHPHDQDDSTPSPTNSSDGSTGTFIVNPGDEYEQQLFDNIAAGNSASAFADSTRHNTYTANQPTQHETLYTVHRHRSQVDPHLNERKTLHHRKDHNLPYKLNYSNKSQKHTRNQSSQNSTGAKRIKTKVSVKHLKDKFENPQQSTGAHISRAKSVPNLSKNDAVSTDSWHSLSRTCTFPDITDESCENRHLEYNMDPSLHNTHHSWNNDRPDLQTNYDTYNNDAHSLGPVNHEQDKLKLSSDRGAPRGRYDPYIPPHDIYREVEGAREGRKLDVPKKKFHSPSIAGKMTLEYFDLIGSEWQQGRRPRQGKAENRMEESSHAIEEHYKPTQSQLNNSFDFNSHASLFSGSQTDDMKLSGQGTNFYVSHNDSQEAEGSQVSAKGFKQYTQPPTVYPRSRFLSTTGAERLQTSAPNSPNFHDSQQEHPNNGDYGSTSGASSGPRRKVDSKSTLVSAWVHDQEWPQTEKAPNIPPPPTSSSISSFAASIRLSTSMSSLHMDSYSLLPEESSNRSQDQGSPDGRTQNLERGRLPHRRHKTLTQSPIPKASSKLSRPRSARLSSNSERSPTSPIVSQQHLRQHSQTSTTPRAGIKKSISAWNVRSGGDDTGKVSATSILFPKESPGHYCQPNNLPLAGNLRRQSSRGLRRSDLAMYRSTPSLSDDRQATILSKSAFDKSPKLAGTYEQLYGTPVPERDGGQPRVMVNMPIKDERMRRPPEKFIEVYGESLMTTPLFQGQHVDAVDGNLHPKEVMYTNTAQDNNRMQGSSTSGPIPFHPLGKSPYPVAPSSSLPVPEPPDRGNSWGSSRVVMQTWSNKDVQGPRDTSYSAPPPPRPTHYPQDFRHQTTDVIRKSLPAEDKERRRKEEDENYRKQRLEELYEEERRKRIQLEAEKNAARKHHDFFTPAQKSPISPNRFDDVPNQSPPAGYSAGQSQLRSPQPIPSQTSTLTATLSVPPERRRGFQIQGKAKALFNFTAQNPRELSFRKGDTLYLLRQIDKNWFEGEHHGRAGIFPVNYVEVLTSIEAAQSAALDAEGQARAKYNFTGQSSVELTLKKGETVTLLRHVDENWCEGRIHGRQGIFPTSYIEILREPSTPLITPAPSVITTPMAGTPEMLSPVSMEPPTPPPQPSPSAFSSQHTSNYNPYWQQQQQQPSSSLSQQPWGTISSISNNSGYNKNIANNGIGSSSGTNNRMQYDSYRTLYGGHDPAQSVRSPELQIYGHKGPISPASGPLKVSQPQASRSVSAAPMPKSNINIFTTSLAGGPSRQPKPEIKVSDDDLALQRYRALYAYRPQSEDELELREGDEVFVMERCDDGWYVGTSARSGQFGTFPGNYVQKL